MATSLSADLEAKASRQLSNLRSRVKHNVKAVLQGDWAGVQSKYKPQGGPAKESKEWTVLAQKQDVLMANIGAAERARDQGECKYNVILKVRKAWPEIARNFDVPEKPAAMVRAEAAAAQSERERASLRNDTSQGQAQQAISDAAQHAGDKRKAAGLSLTGIKQEPIEVDDGETEDGEYDPAKDAGPAKRAERAVKRQRTDDVTARIKKSDDPDDLKMQLQEIEMKTNLQKLQLQRAAKNKQDVDQDDVKLQLQEMDMKADLQKLQINRKLAALKKKAIEAKGG